MPSIDAKDLKLAISLLPDKYRNLRKDVEGALRESAVHAQSIRNQEKRKVYKGDATEDIEECKDWIQALNALHKCL